MMYPDLQELRYTYSPYPEPHPEGVHQFCFSHAALAEPFVIWLYVEKAKEGMRSLGDLRQEAHTEAQRYMAEQAAKQKKRVV